jgi:hypothetical protein
MKCEQRGDGQRGHIRNELWFPRTCPLIASALSKDGPDEITIDLVSDR